MSEATVGVIGARSIVGDHLLRMLQASGVRVIAYTRKCITPTNGRIEWRSFVSGATAVQADTGEPIPDWIIAAPIWVMAQHYALLASCGARRVIALSSTSRFVKSDSSDRVERCVAAKLAEGEAALETWSTEHRVDWVVLRPTLIYGGGKDKNIATAARFIRRFGFYPLVGQGSGLRQPVHAADVATACVLALHARHLTRHSYNISSGVSLTYAEMIEELFRVLGRKPRFVRMPPLLVSAAIGLLRVMPTFRHLTAAMGERMDRDLVFNNASAVSDLGFAPRAFRLTEDDLPQRAQ